MKTILADIEALKLDQPLRRRDGLMRDVNNPKVIKRAEDLRKIEKIKEEKEMDLSMEAELDRVMKSWNVA
jgi:hypothetical protein